MREIKFRSWNKAKKQWFDTGDIHINAHGEIFYYDLDGKIWPYIETGVVDIQQYTGLKDKNGKEIYEGDILEFLDYVGTGEYNSWDEEIQRSFLNRKVVNFGNIRWEHVGHWNCKGEYMAEIIGNIYENPELLERDEK